MKFLKIAGIVLGLSSFAFASADEKHNPKSIHPLLDLEHTNVIDSSRYFFFYPIYNNHEEDSSCSLHFWAHNYKWFFKIHNCGSFPMRRFLNQHLHDLRTQYVDSETRSFTDREYVGDIINRFMEFTRSPHRSRSPLSVEPLMGHVISG